MPYSEMLVKPMREELSSAGVEELRTAEDVDRWMDQREGTALLIVNSVCGCAAGSARPAVRAALAGRVRPDRIATVFAEGRWDRADDELGGDFEDLGTIDLSGRRVFGGLAWHF